MKIRALQESDIEFIRLFADRAIGKNYFSSSELKDVFSQSTGVCLESSVMCSFVLVDDQDKIHGIRLAYAPGAWTKGKGSKLRPDLWGVPADKVGYFQSLFLADDAQGSGWGPKLSEASIEAMRKLGAVAVVTHAWKESPNNSSLRYLTRFGFTEVATHPDYWVDVNYECTRDGKPCRCTAIEMIKRL